ncbi:hypothetical protein BU15DRAFT_66854 [Melanogaster broomeanus]|nr:hypothetical protein BU15DRAFT_66854 [Melanogaster broomeanus]
MSTPPTRSPGPANIASSPPPLHEDTTPRISSPLNPSPKPLAPPLPRSPHQHTLAHAHTSSTEFPRMSTTSDPSLASQSQNYSPYRSSGGGGNTTEHVSLALTSIFPASTIKKLSPAGKAVLKAGRTVSTIGHALSPIIQEGLITAVDALAFVPLPGLEVAARALLGVWEACRPVVAKF